MNNQYSTIQGRKSSELGFGLPKLGFADERREGNLWLSSRDYSPEVL
jgi:hypothetical protein